MCLSQSHTGAKVMAVQRPTPVIHDCKNALLARLRSLQGFIATCLIVLMYGQERSGASRTSKTFMGH